jgi:small subunit ribosomal protein S6
MPLYEHVFLARQDLATAQVDALTESLTKIVEDHQGRVEKTEYWGLRSLAYRIKKNRKAHYVMLNITAPAGTVAELERNVRLNEDVLRYMTIRVDALEAEPSAMMRRDRDGRRGDRRGGRDGRDSREGGREGRDGGPREAREPRADREGDRVRA